MKHYWTKLLAVVSLSGGIIATAVTLGAWTSTNPTVPLQQLNNSQAKVSSTNWKPEVKAINVQTHQNNMLLAYNPGTRLTYVNQYNVLYASSNGIDFRIYHTFIDGEVIHGIYTSRGGSKVMCVITDTYSNVKNEKLHQNLYYSDDGQNFQKIYESSKQYEIDSIKNLVINFNGITYLSFNSVGSKLWGVWTIEDLFQPKIRRVGQIPSDLEVDKLYCSSANIVYATGIWADSQFIYNVAYASTGKGIDNFVKVDSLTLSGAAAQYIHLWFGMGTEVAATIGGNEGIYYLSQDAYQFTKVVTSLRGYSIEQLQFTPVGTLYLIADDDRVHYTQSPAKGQFQTLRFQFEAGTAYTSGVDFATGEVYYANRFQLLYSTTGFGTSFNEVNFSSDQTINAVKNGMNNLTYIITDKHVYYISNQGSQTIGNVYAKTTYKFLWDNVYFGVNNQTRQTLSTLLETATSNGISSKLIKKVFLNLNFKFDSNRFKYDQAILKAGMKRLMKDNFSSNIQSKSPIEVHFTTDVITPLIYGYPARSLTFRGYNYAYNP